jgi:1-acyl-sn-glycerol-3-phosphate acyltransferase
VQPVYELTLGSPYRSAWRLASFLLLVATVSVVQTTCLVLKTRLATIVPMLYHRVCCWLLDIRIEKRGTMSTVTPTLFVCNHTSYLDITVLGSLVPGSFVAKSEVARWPFFGSLAKLQRTIFVDRRRHTTHTQRDELRRRLDEGGHVVLFPEGTSNDGNRTLPFRSALFSVAEPRQQAGEAGPVAELTVQPVSIAYVRLNGLPIGHGLRPLFAWYGDMDLFAHLVSLAGLGALTVRVEFHPQVPFSRFGSRKALSEHCHRAVAEGVDRAIRGK